MFRNEEKKSAMDFIKVRRRLRALHGLKLDEISISNSDEDKWVGLYLDERGIAGEEKFTIGGIYVVGPADKDKWNKFEESLIPKKYIECLRALQEGIKGNNSPKDIIKLLGTLKKEIKVNNKLEYIKRLGAFKKEIKVNNKLKYIKLLGTLKKEIKLDNRSGHIRRYDNFKKGKIKGLKSDDFFIRTIKLTTDRKEPDDIEAVSIHKNMLKKLVGKLFLGVILPLLKEKASIKIKKVFIRYGTCVRPAKNKALMIKMGYDQVPGTLKHFTLNKSELDKPSLKKKYIEPIFADCKIDECRGVVGDNFEAFQVIADAILDEYKNLKIKAIQAELDQYPGMYERYRGEENDSLSYFVDANEYFYEYNDDEKYFRALDAITRNEAWESVEEVIKVYKQSPNIYSILLLWHTRIIKAYNNLSPNTARAYICERLSKGLHQKISTTPKENFYKLCRLKNSI